MQVLIRLAHERQSNVPIPAQGARYGAAGAPSGSNRRQRHFMPKRYCRYLVEGQVGAAFADPPAQGTFPATLASRS